MRRRPLGPLENPVRRPVPLHQLAIACEPRLDRQGSRDDLLDDLPTFPAEVERGADAFGCERKALAGRVAHGEETPRGRAAEPVREVGAVIVAGSDALVLQIALQRGPQLRSARIGTKPDQAPGAHREDPAETVRNHLPVEEEGEPIVPKRGARLEPERVCTPERPPAAGPVDENAAPA